MVEAKAPEAIKPYLRFPRLGISGVISHVGKVAFGAKVNALSTLADTNSNFRF